jgi:hypothetical protein
MGRISDKAAMEFTVTLDPNAAKLALLHTAGRGISFSQAINELVFLATQAKGWIKWDKGFPRFDVREGRTLAQAHIRTLVE